MKAHTPKAKEALPAPLSANLSQKKSGETPVFSLANARPEFLVQRKLQDMALTGPQAEKATALQKMAHTHASRRFTGVKKQFSTGVSLNNEAALEQEATLLGARAAEGVAPAQNASPVSLKEAPAVQRQVIQRTVKEVAVTGITHLVSLKGGSLYNEDYLSNEEAEIGEGDFVEIEDAEPLGSRRGPNQEEFNKIDKTGPQWYIWYPVRSLNNRAVKPGTYIREDTFRKLTKEEKLKHQSEDPYEYVAEFALSREGKHWWASFNEKDNKRQVGENVINSYAASNIKKVKENQDELLSHLIKEEDIELFKEKLKLDNKPFGNTFKKGGKYEEGLKTKPNLFIKSLLEDNPEDNLFKTLLDEDDEHENTILNCEEFAMYVLVQSGFMTRKELSALLKKAKEDGNLEVVYTAMGFASAFQLTPESIEEQLPKTGIIFEKKNKDDPAISHVVFCAGSQVIHLAFGKTLAEWRAKVESTESYLKKAQNKYILYSPLSRRNVESAIGSLSNK